MDSILKTMESVAKSNIPPSKIIQIAVIILIAVAAFIAVVIISRRLRKKVNIDDIRRKHIYVTVFRVIKVLIVIAALFAILQTAGVNLSAFSIGFGLILLLVAFAVKDSFQDIFSGLIILTDKYFTVGDAVEFEGKDGVVISFTVRTTKIEMLDDRSVVSISNRNITKIKKLTHLVDIDLPLSYELTKQEAFDILTPICEKIGALEGVEKCELKGTQEFAASAAIYKIRFFCEPNDRPDIRRSVVMTIQEGLDAAGIRIPYQQLDVHTKE